MSNDEWARQRKDNHVSSGYSSDPFGFCSPEPIIPDIVTLCHHDWCPFPLLSPIRTCVVADLPYHLNATERG